MIDRGKRLVLGVRLDGVDYEAAVERVARAARDRQPLAVSALAVHGVMTSVMSPQQRYRINRLDLVTPDGQPVRWALNFAHATRLPDQVHGAVLTEKLLERAQHDRLPVMFYGSSPERLRRLAVAVRARYPALVVTSYEPSLFRLATSSELDRIAQRIRACGARMCFVGLGCPRQELFVSAMRERVQVPMLAVGAAFDYIAGTLPAPPAWMRRGGLEWAWRLALEPRRLWRRYLLLNPAYVTLLFASATGVWAPEAAGVEPDPDAPIPA